MFVLSFNVDAMDQSGTHVDSDTSLLSLKLVLIFRVNATIEINVFLASANASISSKLSQNSLTFTKNI